MFQTGMQKYILGGGGGDRERGGDKETERQRDESGDVLAGKNISKL